MAIKIEEEKGGEVLEVQLTGKLVQLTGKLVKEDCETSGRNSRAARPGAAHPTEGA